MRNFQKSTPPKQTQQYTVSLNVYPKTCRFCNCPPIPGDDFCYGCAARESD